jgi:hypothetical protein
MRIEFAILSEVSGSILKQNGLLPFERLGGQFFSEIIPAPSRHLRNGSPGMFSEHAAGELVLIGARLSPGGAEVDRPELT